MSPEGARFAIPLIPLSNPTLKFYRMLRKAEAVVRLLENPSARPNEQPQPDDNQEEEVTPVIEARVLVPTNENEPIDEAMVLSAVQNSLFNVGAV